MSIPPPAALHARIFQDRLRFNVALTRAHVPQGIELMAVIKNDAYGHGLIPMARALETCGVERLVVGSVAEGMAVRVAGIRCPVLVLSDPLCLDVRSAVAHDLTLTVDSVATASALLAERPPHGRSLTVQVKVDTGLGRFGVGLEQASGVMASLYSAGHVRVEGVYSHLATTFRDDQRSNARTQAQLVAFTALLDELDAAKLLPPLVHIGSSTGLIGFAHEVCTGYFNALRIGSLFYGFMERAHDWPQMPIPVAEIQARIMLVRRVAAGSSVGYHGDHVVTRDSLVAVMHGGYAHGLRGDAAQALLPLVGGCRTRMIGRPTLGQTLLDVTDAPLTVPGTEVVLAGRELNMCAVATALGKGTWEVLLPLLQHAKREYL